MFFPQWLTRKNGGTCVYRAAPSLPKVSALDVAIGRITLVITALREALIQKVDGNRVAAEGVCIAADKSCPSVSDIRYLWA